MTNPCSFTTELNAHLLLHCDLTVEGELISQGDIVHSGNAVGFFGATPVVQPSALTASDSGTVDILYTASERDVILNLRTRVNELEAKLQGLGLLS